MTNKSKINNTFSKTPRTLQRVQGVFSYVKQKKKITEQNQFIQEYAPDKETKGRSNPPSYIQNKKADALHRQFYLALSVKKDVTVIP